VGEVLAVHVDSGVVDAAGHLEVERLRPFVLNYREYWSMGECIGRFGSGAPPFKVIP
jgi:flavin reductase (DIM6/NTAB) family NADH-FMN oxidoreductase RutF